MTITAGSRLGPYEIVAPIGAGGMGEVFRARDTRLERNVAIKILPPSLAHDPQFRARFEREAKTISQLNHPHICQIYDVGLGTGGWGSGTGDFVSRLQPPVPSPDLQPLSYIVMEYLEGESLADRLARGALPLPDVLRYGAQIADALAAAHRAGIVHRDLKPGNVMITKPGAKLLDFGLAKGASAGAIQVDGTGATEHKPLTARGTIVGTFQYMAPEQLEGEEADPRTDIFALGSLLYEMLTGQRAFEGQTRTSLIAAIVSGEPRPVRQLQPMTPPALEHVIRKCLAKDRENRWQSVHDVAEELRWIAEAGSEAGVAAPLIAKKKSRERLWWTAAVVVALAAGALAARTLWPDGQAKEIYRFSIPTHQGEIRQATGFVIRRDGTGVVIQGLDREDKQHLWVRKFDTPAPKKLEGSEGLLLGRFTPDGQSLILGAGGKIVRLPAEGGTPQLLAEVGQGWSAPRATHSGVLVLTGPDERLYRIARPGATPEPITNLDKSRHEIGHVRPNLLPDGERFLFTTFRRDPNARGFSSDLYIGSVDGKPAKRIVEISSNVDYALGHLYFVRDGALQAAPFDLDELRFTGEASPVADGVWYYKQTSSAAFDVADDGTIAYLAPRGGAQMTWFDLAGKELAQLGPRADIESAYISRDGSTIYTAESSPRDGVRHLWSHDATRGTTARLSFDWAWEGSPVLSADGQQLFYSSDRGDYPDVFVKPADGSEAGRLVVREAQNQSPQDASPDGRYLLYQTTKNVAETRTDLWAIALDGSAEPFPVVRTPGRDRNGRISPDGTMITYISDVSGTDQVYVKPFPGAGKARQVSLAGGTLARWSPDGRNIYFIHKQSVMGASLDAGSEPRELFRVKENIRTFDVAPDGKRLLLVLASDEDLSPPINVIIGWKPPEK